MNIRVEFGKAWWCLPLIIIVAVGPLFRVHKPCVLNCNIFTVHMIHLGIDMQRAQLLVTFSFLKSSTCNLPFKHQFLASF